MYTVASRHLICAALALALVPACKITINGPGVNGEPRRDAASTADAGLDTGDSRPDAPAPDLPQPDMPLADLPLPDLPQPDLPQPDLPQPDLLPPDVAQPDLPLPDQAVPDLLPPDATPPDQMLPDFGTIAGVWLRVNKGTQTTQGYATIKPGKSVTFDGVVSCPAAFGCKYAWDLGNGKTSTAKSPGAVTYAKVGMYHVTFTVRDKKNTVLGKARADVVVWTGKHTDSFFRLTVPPTLECLFAVGKVPRHKCEFPRQERHLQRQIQM